MIYLIGYQRDSPVKPLYTLQLKPNCKTRFCFFSVLPSLSVSLDLGILFSFLFYFFWGEIYSHYSSDCSFCLCFFYPCSCSLHPWGICFFFLFLLLRRIYFSFYFLYKYFSLCFILYLSQCDHTIT